MFYFQGKSWRLRLTVSGATLQDRPARDGNRARNNRQSLGCPGAPWTDLLPLSCPEPVSSSYLPGVAFAAGQVARAIRCGAPRRTRHNRPHGASLDPVRVPVVKGPHGPFTARGPPAARARQTTWIRARGFMRERQATLASASQVTFMSVPANANVSVNRAGYPLARDRFAFQALPRLSPFWAMRFTRSAGACSAGYARRSKARLVLTDWAVEFTT